MSEAACSYDLDQCDEAWLKVLNGERALSGLVTVTEEQFERVVEELEVSLFFVLLCNCVEKGQVHIYN